MITLLLRLHLGVSRRPLPQLHYLLPLVLLSNHSCHHLLLCHRLLLPLLPPFWHQFQIILSLKHLLANGRSALSLNRLPLQLIYYPTAPLHKCPASVPIFILVLLRQVQLQLHGANLPEALAYLRPNLGKISIGINIMLSVACIRQDHLLLQSRALY